MHLYVLVVLVSAMIFVSGNHFSEIQRINKAQSYWKAGMNWNSDKGIKYMRKLLGAKIDTFSILPIKDYTSFVHHIIPETFDARKEWPQCHSISVIDDQGICGSCWAVAAASCMTDRLCIAGVADNITISTQNLLSCCWYCGNGCSGGYMQKAWKYFSSTGIVTGGNYHSYEGCQPYEVPPAGYKKYSSINSNCHKTCTNTNYSVPYQEDKHYGVKAYSVQRNVNAIQYEILINGPVDTVFYVYNDFLYYRSGVYVRTSKKYVGVHAVRVLGWGTDNGTDYWLVANSWNKNWGVKGTFKIRRGTNECGFESYVTAGSVSKI